jgi:uncharacterized protein YqjF (DUF2071 family)
LREGSADVNGDFNAHILDEVDHRPWEVPAGPWLMRQTWHDLLFAHWPVDPGQLAGRLPPQFPLDLLENKAWVGIVPFHMTNVAPRGVPALPWVSEFPELNVRTYVRVDDRPGIYFLSLDAASAAAVYAARMLLNLPYHSASMSVVPTTGGIEYTSRRTHEPATFHAFYGPTAKPSVPTRGSVEYFLTERYCLYNLDRRGAPYRLDIHHPPWPLQPAQANFARNTMGDVNHLSLPARPVWLHFAKRQDMVAWAPRRLT